LFIFAIQKSAEMNKQKQDIAYFVSFCIEQYKTAKGISGKDAVDLLNQYGVLEYLEKHYEPLHTQGKQWLLEEIDEFIKIRKGASA
jgi:5'-3' exonuclease